MSINLRGLGDIDRRDRLGEAVKKAFSIGCREKFREDSTFLLSTVHPTHNSLT